MTRRGAGRLPTFLFLAIGVILTGVALLVYAVEGLRDQELQTVDARFQVRGERAAPQDLVVVKIDDVTFDELGLRWPFRRTVHALALRRIAADGRGRSPTTCSSRSPASASRTISLSRKRSRRPTERWFSAPPRWTSVAGRGSSVGMTS
jgi:hypothetical protein